MSSPFEWNLIRDEWMNSKQIVLNNVKQKMDEVFQELEQYQRQILHNCIQTTTQNTNAANHKEKQQHQEQNSLIAPGAIDAVSPATTSPTTVRNVFNDIQRKMNKVLNELEQTPKQIKELLNFNKASNAITTTAATAVLTAKTTTSANTTTIIMKHQEQIAAATSSSPTTNKWINRANRRKPKFLSESTSASATSISPLSLTPLSPTKLMREKSIHRNGQLQNNFSINHVNENGNVPVQRSLPERVFVQRDSYLTTLYQVDHIKAIYHIFLVIFLILCLHTITHDYFTMNRLQIGLKTWKAGFGQFPTVLLFWMGQQLFVISLWPAVKIWTQVKKHLMQKNQYLQSFWSYSCLGLYIISQIFFHTASCWLCIKWKLPFATGIALQLDTVRLLMKMHAFVRTNVPLLMHYKSESIVNIENQNKMAEMDETKIRMPPIRNYIYFLFAPTLIYRDHYPRTASIRWRFVLARFIEMIAIIFINTFIYEHFIRNVFSDFGLKTWCLTELCLKFVSILMPCDLLLLADFYLILHSWHNVTGELLKFGDRTFYKDWWTAANYETYFRKWNVIVHDWLYEYIYKDFHHYIFQGNKLYALLAVFTISALFHELCINFTFNFFFPATYVLFGIIGVLLVFITRIIPKSMGNILLWFTLIFGNGMLITLYTMEYYGNLNCPKIINKWYDHLVPHIWYCYRKTFK